MPPQLKSLNQHNVIGACALRGACALLLFTSYVLTIAMWIANAGHAHPPRLYSDLAEEHRALESRLLFP
eukprot:255537-Prorocentrum_minimum.AAC.3